MAAVASGYTAPDAGQFLTAEYPAARQRAQAIRWLGWIADIGPRPNASSVYPLGHAESN